jgi:hypothetical protein
MIKKRFMTLLETLVAMSLLSILLIFFFGIFRELAFIQDQDQEDYKKTFYNNYSQLRLNYIFSHLGNENNSDADTKFYFYIKKSDNISGSPSLVFMYNNGVRRDPFFSSELMGRLYVDEEKKELRLANWPFNLKNPHPHFFQEILMPNVEAIHFEFLSAPDESWVNVGKKAPISDRGQWQNTWDDSYKELPIIMKMFIKLKDVPEEKQLVFTLPVHRFSIIF